MATEDLYFKRSKGAELIKAYCYKYAKSIGVKLISVSWTTDHDKIIANKILTIKLESKIIKIGFNKEEIENYPGRTGTDKNKSKIEQAISG